MRVTTRYAAVLVGVLAAAGCGGGGGATKAGGPTGPVTLQMAVDDVMDGRREAYAELFAARVEELSDGRLRVKLRHDAARASGDFYVKLARAVKSGKFELGMVPTDVWDLLGVTSLRALNAPFLISDQTLLADVVSGELAATMLSGLDRADAVGLALLPAKLSHPLGYDRPLLGPEDYRGKVLVSASSRTTDAVLHALGAKSVAGQAADRNLQAGQVAALDSFQEGVSTGNVVLSAAVDSFVIGARAYERLGARDREIVKEAAAEMRALAIATVPDDVDLAREFCAHAGGTSFGIVLATAAQLAGLETAAAPVYAELERDPLTRSVIAGIRARRRAIAARTKPMPACPGKPTPPISGTASTALDGVYRFELTDEELDSDPELVSVMHGVFTYTLSSGKYCYEQKMPDSRSSPNPNHTPGACGIYRLSGDRLTMSLRTGPPATLRWSRTARGDLNLTVLDWGSWAPAIANAMVTKPWQRIGD